MVVPAPLTVALPYVLPQLLQRVTGTGAVVMLWLNSSVVFIDCKAEVLADLRLRQMFKQGRKLARSRENVQI